MSEDWRPRGVALPKTPSVLSRGGGMGIPEQQFAHRPPCAADAALVRPATPLAPIASRRGEPAGIAVQRRLWRVVRRHLFRPADTAEHPWASGGAMISAPRAPASVERIAALPMYDVPGLQPANEALWQALSRRLIAAGIEDVPERLTPRPSALGALARAATAAGAELRLSRGHDFARRGQGGCDAALPRSGMPRRVGAERHRRARDHSAETPAELRGSRSRHRRGPRRTAV
jgi:hypothetical protein